MTSDAAFEKLLAGATAGVGDDLGTLLEQFRGYLTLLARAQVGRRLQGKADPSDLVQEACLEASKHVPMFRGTTEEEFTAWLRKILASVVSNQFRKYLGTQQRDARLEQALQVELDSSSGALQRALASPISSPSGQVAKRESLSKLADAIEKLPADYRDVLILRHFEGLQFAEVAARMGRTLPSVHNLWLRALARIRQHVGES